MCPIMNGKVVTVTYIAYIIRMWAGDLLILIPLAKLLLSSSSSSYSYLGLKKLNTMLTIMRMVPNELETNMYG